MGMDLELIPWLNQYAFAEEKKYADAEYAAAAYSAFCAALKSGVTTRAAIFASLHVPATEILMDMLEQSGLATYVGKVNMDRNCPDYLVENTQNSISDTESWVRRSLEAYRKRGPLSRRGLCRPARWSYDRLGEIAARYDLPVQSHLSENVNEIKWVKELHPTATPTATYTTAAGFGQQPTLMASLRVLTDYEMDLVRERGVLAVHCPQSNINISMGIAPVRRMLEEA